MPNHSLYQETWSDDDQDHQLDKKSKFEINSRLSKKLAKSFIREDVEGDPIDLLNPLARSNVLSRLPKKNSQIHGNHELKRKKTIIPIAEDGRIDIGELLGITKNTSKRKLEDSDNEAGDSGPSGYKPGGKGIHRMISGDEDTKSMMKSGSKKSKPMRKLASGRKQDLKSNVWRGESYRSKKANGDMKRKGMPDPFAYYPLNAINKRKAAKRQGEFRSIMKGAQKGAKKGKHLKKMRNKKK